MDPKDTPPIKVIEKKAEPDPAGVHRHDKRRRHGYRGYPNNPSVGGDVHSGTGFAGVGSTTGGAGSSDSGVLTEKTRESIEEVKEEEEE